jgi:colanic acid/amylovoran biosynthesis protein
MLRIFIDFGSESAAIGSHAMVISTLKLLQEIFPGAEFNILSIYPNVDRRRYGSFGFNLNIVRRARGNAGAAWAQLRQCSKADMVVGVYGDGFVASTNLAFLEFIAKMWVVTLPGKPLVVFPSSMGPFSGWRSPLARWALKRAKLIAAREETTYRYLVETGVDKRLISLVPDIAFALPSAPQARLEEILVKEGINTAQKPLIGLRVHPLNVYPDFSEAKQDYIQLMAQVTDYLVTSLNATVVFIPYYIWPKEVTKMRDIAARAGGDDITLIRNVFKKVQRKDRVISIETEYGAVELNGIIGQCDLFIGAQLHCNIAAISMCVAPISIDFRYKTPAVMKMVGLEKYHCDLRTVTFSELTGKIDDLWTNRERIRKMLEFRVEEFRTSIRSLGESLTELLNPPC